MSSASPSTGLGGARWAATRRSQLRRLMSPQCAPPIGARSAATAIGAEAATEAATATVVVTPLAGGSAAVAAAATDIAAAMSGGTGTPSSSSLGLGAGAFLLSSTETSADSTPFSTACGKKEQQTRRWNRRATATLEPRAATPRVCIVRAYDARAGNQKLRE